MSYRMNSIGQLELQGQVQGTNVTALTHLCILPTLFHPIRNTLLVLLATTSGSRVPGDLTLDVNGAIKVTNGATLTANTAYEFSVVVASRNS